MTLAITDESFIGSDSGHARNTRGRCYRCSVPGLAGFTRLSLCGARSLILKHCRLSTADCRLGTHCRLPISDCQFPIGRLTILELYTNRPISNEHARIGNRHLAIVNFMAERVGFEPTVRFPVHSISSAANSTTLAPLRTIANFLLPIAPYQLLIPRWRIVGFLQLTIGNRQSAMSWRRGWDSNPRWALTHSGFRDRFHSSA
jgi:hypothetical protein